MVGLPLILGSKSVASRYVSEAQPIEVFDEVTAISKDLHDEGNRSDGPAVLYPSSLISCGETTTLNNSGSSSSSATIVTAQSLDQELLAVVTIYYYNMMRRRPDGRDEEEIAYCIAELHIQISLMGESTSLSGRDSMHRIPLQPIVSPQSPNPTQDCDVTAGKYPVIPSAALFSSDRRYLTCLIAHPHSSSIGPNQSPQSTVVVFQLRKPKAETPIDRPPLPSYIVPSKITLPIVTVATNPRILPIQNASALCNVVSTSLSTTTTLKSTHNCSASILIGCWDGSVKYLNHLYRRPFMIWRVELFKDIDLSDNTTIASLPIIALDHWLEDTVVSSDKGRLAVVFGDGTAMIYQSQFTNLEPHDNGDHQKDHSYFRNNYSDTVLIQEDSESESHRKWDMNISDRSTSSHPNKTFDFQLRQTYDLRNFCVSTTLSIISVKWICSSYLIAIEEPKNTESTIHVFKFDNQCTNDNSLFPLSTMTMTKSLLEELTDTSLTFENDGNTVHTVQQRPDVAIEYDRYSDCIIVASYLCIGYDKVSTRQTFCSFTCLWKWRANVLGYTMCHTAQNPPHEMIRSASSYFGINYKRQRKFVCVTSIYNMIHHNLRIQKESYNVAIISPPYESHPKIRESTSLLLSASSIAYPVVSKSSNMNNYEIDWMESSIPNSYRSAYGAPRLATIGKRYSRSIAIASSRGFCVLDRSCDYYTATTVHSVPKWRLFAHESHEKQFRVVAFLWWEGVVQRTHLSKKNHDYLFDDILVAVVEILECPSNQCGFFLSCWSVKDIKLSGQLLQSESRSVHGISVSSAFKWGLQLPTDFTPSGIDLLSLPICDGDGEVSHSERIATVLISESSATTTSYRIYQLRRHSNDSKTGNVQHIISAGCTAFGRIESPAELFVASSSFTSRHRKFDDNSYLDEYTVLGVMYTQSFGADAILVSESSSAVLDIGHIVKPNHNHLNDPYRNEISQYWLSDTIHYNVCTSTNQSLNSFEWIFQLMNGSLVGWSIPFPLPINQLIPPLRTKIVEEYNESARFVDGQSHILGITSPAGSIASWMQQSTRGVQHNFRGGTVPQGAFGYVVGMNQSYKKVTTSKTTTMDDNNLFRANLYRHLVMKPGELTLYPPTYLPTLNVHAVEIPSTASSNHLENYVRVKLIVPSQQDTVILSLQLTLLRLVERLTKISQSYSSNSRRQMEISCLPHLFPLPETIDGLYSIAAAYGSIPTSVSALPTFTDKSTTNMICTDMFHACIDRLDRVFQRPIWFDFDVCTDEFNSIGEIFRYALKMYGEVHGTNMAINDDPDSDDEGTSTTTLSIMCGMSKLFSFRNANVNVNVARKNNEEAAPLLIHGISDSKIIQPKGCGVRHLHNLGLWHVHSCIDKFVNIPQLSARFVVSSIYGGSILDSEIGWIKVGLLATAIMSDMCSEYFHNTDHPFTKFIEATKVSHILALAPLDIRRDGIMKVLDYFINNCHDSIDPEVANRIFDLLTVLLDSDVSTFQSDLPGLLMVAIVAAHKADRICDILSTDSDAALCKAYFELYSNQPDM